MELLQALMSGQGLTQSEAKSVIREMRKRLAEGEDPEEILYEEGLEPDYMMDLF